MSSKPRFGALLLAICGMAGVPLLGADPVLVVGGEGRNCNEDPQCVNRFHPDTPMTARAKPGQKILLRTRNASDFDLDPASTHEDPRKGDPQFGTVHPLTGPIHIEGARAGDVLAVTLLDIDPGPFGYTLISGIGFVTDQIAGPLRVTWRLDREHAVSDAIPGVRIPNASFPGVISVQPGPRQHAEMLAREAALAAAGGQVLLPHALHAAPAALCGPTGSDRQRCLRTIPPREHGGNLDIRYLGVGATIYLPCQVDGCGLAVGDLHYAQGDGEVSGTAIEMDADVLLTTALHRAEDSGSGAHPVRGPHYSGDARLLDIPSRRFHATTGFPLKAAGEVPPDMTYLQSGAVAGLTNLSKDISLAARNALLEMIDYITQHHGLTRQQAYLVASVAVDLRIGQLVDAPNVGVTAILPLDIFVGTPAARGEGSPAPMPAWLQQHMEFLTRDGGRWIADNTPYRSDNEPFDAYGLEWKWGIGKKSVTGRLFGLRDGAEVATFWEFRTVWHPGQGRAMAYQFGGNGVYAEGTIESNGAGQTRAEQVFHNPDGTNSTVGHESVDAADGTHITRSFDVQADGTWQPRRSYTWKREAPGTP